MKQMCIAILIDDSLKQFFAAWQLFARALLEISGIVDKYESDWLAFFVMGFMMFYQKWHLCQGLYAPKELSLLVFQLVRSDTWASVVTLMGVLQTVNS